MGEIFYKYVHPRRIGILESLKIRASQPSALNDPHECIAGIDWTAPFRETAGNHPKVRALAEKFSIAPEVLQLVIEAQARNPVIVGNYDPDAKLMAKIDGHYGVISMSRSVSEPRLWAHYADGHRGLAIGFDSDAEPLKDSILHVRYESHPPQLGEPETWPSASRPPVNTIMGTKPTWWAYEQEVRAIKILPDKREADPVDDYGFHVALVAIPPHAIKQVVFGARSSAALRAEAIAACAKSGIAPEFLCMRRETGAYTLICDPIKERNG